MKNLTIVGSINTDLVFKCNKEPIIGETVIGDEFSIYNGGKGANNAIAIARLGYKVNLIACVGEDDFSKSAVKNLHQNYVTTKYIKVVPKTKGGVALITVANKNNKIIVVSGANALVSEDDIKRYEQVISSSSIVGSQLEIPLKTVETLCKVCKKNKVPFVFNPSPIKALPKSLIKDSTYIIVNEVEIEYITGYDKEKPFDVLKDYPNKLILTKGAEGAYFCDGKQIINVPALKVNVVDTTGAGDTFMGTFMTAIAEGKSVYDSVSFANTCAGIKTTKLGAQTAMPTMSEVKKFLVTLRQVKKV